MKQFLFAIFLIFMFCSYRNDPLFILKEVDNPQLLHEAKTLPSTGVLKMTRHLNGGKYVYLHVDERFVTLLDPLLKEKNLTPERDRIGAHITVFTDQEGWQLPETLPELGRTYPFSVKSVAKIEIKTFNRERHREEYREEYMIIVLSPELEALRKKYGEPPLPYGKDPFHITIAEDFLDWAD